MIPGYGTGNAIELYMEDKTGGEMETFYNSVNEFIGALNQRPEVAMAYSSYAMNFPQVAVDVDAAKCKRAGISPNDVLDVVGAYCGGSYVSNFNKFGKVYRVMIQADPASRLDEHALDNMFVRNGDEMAPVSQFVTLRSVLGAEIAKRFNLYNTINVNVNVAEGYSTGEAQQAIREVAAQTLPSGYGYEYGGMAREEASSGGAQTVFIYTLCVVLIYLILACLYESFWVPLAVILYRHQITALERAYTGTSLLMENGNTTYLEVLTARQSLLSAQLSQTANQFKEIQSLINLYQALGGGRNG